MFKQSTHEPIAFIRHRNKSIYKHVNMKGIDSKVAVNKFDGSFSFFHPYNNNLLLNSLSVGGIFFTYFINQRPFRNLYQTAKNPLNSITT